jgi:hypothetical protein
MLFKPEHLDSIYKGAKTQTRRIWKKQRANVGAIHQIKLKMLEKKNYGKILIKNVWKQKLLDITDKEASSEGGYTRESYIKKWFEINPKSPKNPELFVVEFKFLGGQNGRGI